MQRHGSSLRVYIWAGDDVENGYNSPAASLAWLQGVTDADITGSDAGWIKVMDFGAIFTTCRSKSCWTTPQGGSANNWKQQDSYNAEYGILADWPAPEIYNSVNSSGGGNSQYYDDMDAAASDQGVGIPSYVMILHGCGSGDLGYNGGAGAAWQDFVNKTQHHPGSLTDFHAQGNFSASTC